MATRLLRHVAPRMPTTPGRPRVSRCLTVARGPPASSGAPVALRPAVPPRHPLSKYGGGRPRLFSASSGRQGAVAKTKTKGKGKERKERAAGAAAAHAGVAGWVLGKLPPRLATLAAHFLAFLRAYIKGGTLLVREARVAARLFHRIHVSGHRYSRKERLLMRQSAFDLAKALPMAGLMLTLGLEISTLLVLRGAPGMLPSQLQKTVVPEFQKITGAEATEAAKVDQAATARLDTMSQAVNDLRAFAKVSSSSSTSPGGGGSGGGGGLGLSAASVEEKEALMKVLEDLDDSRSSLCHSDILEMAPVFRRYWTLDQMGRQQLRSIADFIMPSRANVVAPASFLRFNLRRHIQHLRVDDKDIYWEGVRSLDYEELFSACNERGLCRRKGQAFSQERVVPQSKAILRARLNSWLQLSLNREVPSSLLLLSVAFIMRDTMTIADKGGPQAVKIAVLETKQRRYHGELKRLQGKIRDVGLDLQRERAELEAQEQAEQAALWAEQAAADACSLAALERSSSSSTSAAPQSAAAALSDHAARDSGQMTAAVIMEDVVEKGRDAPLDAADEESASLLQLHNLRGAQGGISPLQQQLQEEEQEEQQEELRRARKDRKLLSLLRSKEERAVRRHWEHALDRADITARGIGTRRVDSDRWRVPATNCTQTLSVEEAVAALHALLAGHKSGLAADRGPIRSYLVDERRDNDEEGINFTEYVEGYMELRRRVEERTDDQRRAEAVAKLEQLLDDNEDGDDLGAL